MFRTFTHEIFFKMTWTNWNEEAYVNVRQQTIHDGFPWSLETRQKEKNPKVWQNGSSRRDRQPLPCFLWKLFITVKHTQWLLFYLCLNKNILCILTFPQNRESPLSPGHTSSFMSAVAKASWSFWGWHCWTMLFPCKDPQSGFWNMHPPQPLPVSVKADNCLFYIMFLLSSAWVYK